jgi:hypothetical protein
LFAGRIKVTAGSFGLQKPERVLPLREGGVYDVSPDGAHVVMLGEGSSRVQLVVTANWIAQLRARIDASK